MNAAELAGRTYIAAWAEPDREARRPLLERCFAADGRILVGGQVIAGRAALDAAIAELWADPRQLTSRLSSVIDAVGGVQLRFRAKVSDPAGRRFLELLDVGEVDGDGRICALYTFIEPLAALGAAEPAAGTALARAAETYIAMWAEPDRAARRAMLEACFAPDGRLVTGSGPRRGHDEITALVDRVLADPRGLRAWRTSILDAAGAAFRFTSRGAYADGSAAFEALDVCELGGDGRIAVLYTFGGPLRDA